MKFTEHLKTATATGFLVGLIIGIVDIIARIIVWGFEWFELYQTLLLSTALFTFGFIALSLFIQLLGKIMRLKSKFPPVKDGWKFTFQGHRGHRFGHAKHMIDAKPRIKNHPSLKGGFLCAKKSYYGFYFTSGIAILVLFYSGIILNRYIFSKIPFWSPVSLTTNLFVIVFFGIIYFFFLTRGKKLMHKALQYIRKNKIKKIITNIIFVSIFFIISSLIADILLLYYNPNLVSNLNLNENPNIIIVQLEGTRADHLPLYGYDLNTTPNIDRFGKNSIVFERAIAAGTFTIPSVSSIFTGKYPSNHNATAKHHKLNFEEVTIAEILREQGYNTAAFVGSVFLKRKFGLGQGFNTHKDRIDFFEWKQTFEKFGLRETLVTFFPITKSAFNLDGERTAEETNKFIFRWLDKNKDYPFFMFVNYEDTDTISNLKNLGEEFRNRFIDNLEAINYEEVERTLNYLKRYGNVSEDIISSMIKLYDTELFYIDYHLGKLFDKLDELGLKDNTIIIVTSDHGVEFYEHGGFDHGETMYEEAIHVPLIIFYPKKLEPDRIAQRTDAVDILPTILEILDLEIPENIDGQSLLPLIKNEAGYNKDYTMTQHFGQEAHETLQQIAITSKDWKLIEVKPDLETLPSSLFNLRTDPQEQKNLYDLYPDKRKLLREKIINITRGNVELD